MSGHSHWSTIRRQKQLSDQKRGQIFGKITREIQLAAQKGADPNLNPRLKVVLEKAKKLNISASSIQRAIDKGASRDKDVENREELDLEAYGPSGVAILIKVATDNKNRTVAEIRHLLSEYEGSLGEKGSAAFVFGNDPQKPSFTVPVPQSKRDAVLELLAKLRERGDVLQVFSNLTS